MALFHFHVTQIKRSAGQSIVTSAAYRAGEKLYSEYYGEVSDYTHKGGVVCTDILLPPQAPAEYQDRATLWNAVEKAERGKKAQLAYSFDIALQNEFSLEENIALARQFVSEQLVGRGMIADFAIHQPDKEDGGIPNPHFHVLCPIRPIEESGKWGFKQRRVYRLDEDGNRIMGEDGKPLFDAVPTTDWGSPETLEHWREAWAAMVNAKFEEKGLACRIDHRSYERQGIDKIPSIHLGVAASQMERKGIATEKGNINRQIAADNKLLKEIKERITRLYKWTKEQAGKPERKDSIMAQLYEAQLSEGKPGSRYGKIRNLKESAALFNFLNGNHITSMEQLYEKVAAMNKDYYSLRGKIVTAERRIKVLGEHLSMWEKYERNKGTRRQFDKMKPGKKKEQFEQKHSAELALYEAAVRYLEKLKTTSEEITPKKWQAEADRLKAEKSVQYQKMKSMREDIKAVENLKKTAEQLARTENEPARKKEEQEL